MYNRTAEHGEFWSLNILDQQQFSQALSSSDPLTAVNVFAPGQAGALSLTRDTLLGRMLTSGLHARGVVTGPVWTSGDRSVFTSLGAEWRDEDFQFLYDSACKNRRALGFFGELTVSLAENFMLTASGRVDNFSDLGAQPGSQFGLQWKPDPALTLHASFAATYRPPSVGEMRGPRITQLLPVPDLKRDEVVPVLVTFGSNPDLRASAGRTLAVKVEYEPPTDSQLTVAAGYWHISTEDRIGSMPFDMLLKYENQFADRVVRASPTSPDPVGVLQSLDMSVGNLGRLVTSGVDLSASARFSTRVGDWQPTISITRVASYRLAELPVLASDDRVGIASSVGTITRWRSVAQLQWTRGALHASSTMRYVSAYDDTRSGIPTGRKLSGQLLADLQFGVTLPMYSSEPIELAVGAANLFNETPHFAEVNDIWGYDLSQGDRTCLNFRVRGIS